MANQLRWRYDGVDEVPIGRRTAHISSGEDGLGKDVSNTIACNKMSSGSLSFAGAPAQEGPAPAQQGLALQAPAQAPAQQGLEQQGPLLAGAAAGGEQVWSEECPLAHYLCAEGPVGQSEPRPCRHNVI